MTAANLPKPPGRAGGVAVLERIETDLAEVLTRLPEIPPENPPRPAAPLPPPPPPDPLNTSLTRAEETAQQMMLLLNEAEEPLRRCLIQLTALQQTLAQG